MNDYEKLNLSQIKKLDGKFLDDYDLSALEENINVKSIEYINTVGYTTPESIYIMTLIDDSSIEINI